MNTSKLQDAQSWGESSEYENPGGAKHCVIMETQADSFWVY